jgi:hypothetical protein
MARFPTQQLDQSTGPPDHLQVTLANSGRMDG